MISLRCKDLTSYTPEKFVDTKEMKLKNIKLVFIIFFALNLYSNTDSLFIELNAGNVNKNQQAKIYSQIATEYFLSEKFPQSLEYYKYALSIYQSENNQKRTASVYKNIGAVYSEINDYDNSLKFYLDALIIAEDIDAKPTIALINFNLGRLFIKLENFNQALEKINSSLLFYEEDKNTFNKNLINCYANLGIAYGKLENLDSALIFFNKALLMFPEDDLINKGGVLNNIGAIYYKKTKFNDALYHYNKALKYFRESENTRGIGIALFNIAKIHADKKEANLAEDFFKEAIPYLEEGNSIYYLHNCYKELSAFNEEKGEIKKSLEYYKLYTRAKDSIMNTETLNKVASLQIQYNIKKEELKIELLEKDNKIKTIQKYILIMSLIILVVIGLLFYRFFKTKIKNNKLKQELLKSEKKQLKSELEYKNKELETFALQIIQKNEFLENLKNEVKKVSGDSKQLKNISVNISQNLYLEKDREEFQHHLDKIHESFFLRLETKFPKLSKNEKRLCSLLAIDLSSKDIATIINISPESVKKSRYRLRKKLSLSTEDNLSEFLKNI